MYGRQDAKREAGATPPCSYLGGDHRGVFSMETMTGRAKDILLEPRTTWKEIDGEFTKSGEIWGKYILPLAAIGPLANTAGMIVFGRRVPFTSLTTPVPIATAISAGIAQYVLALLSVFVLS